MNLIEIVFYVSNEFAEKAEAIGIECIPGGEVDPTESFIVLPIESDHLDDLLDCITSNLKDFKRASLYIPDYSLIKPLTVGYVLQPTDFVPIHFGGRIYDGAVCETYVKNPLNVESLVGIEGNLADSLVVGARPHCERVFFRKKFVDFLDEVSDIEANPIFVDGEESSEWFVLVANQVSEVIDSSIYGYSKCRFCGQDRKKDGSGRPGWYGSWEGEGSGFYANKDGFGHSEIFQPYVCSLDMAGRFKKAFPNYNFNMEPIINSKSAIGSMAVKYMKLLNELSRPEGGST